MIESPIDVWRKSLELLRTQFEQRGIRSKGLHHLLVEVDDDHKDRLAGPGWFQQENPNIDGGAHVLRESRWRMFEGHTLPGIEPTFREIGPDTVDNHFAADVIRDKQYRPRAVLVKPRLREGYLCGNAEQSDAFKALAAATSLCLHAIPDGLWKRLPNALYWFFQPRSSYELLTFGTVKNIPPIRHSGWETSVYPHDDGVAIVVPRTCAVKWSAEAWLLLLHQIGWSRINGLPVQAVRFAWEGNTSVSLEMLDGTIELSRFPLTSLIGRIPGHSFYSTFGNRDAPLDVFVASVFAIQFLLDVCCSTQQSAAMSMWTEKLEFLCGQEAVVSDPAQKFTLMKNIEEAKAKIRELGGQPCAMQA